MSARLRIRLLILVPVAALAVVVLLAITLGRAPARLPLPNPNGYDDFLKAGAAVSGSVWDYPTLDHDSLRDIVSTNAEALRLLRLGLTRQCSVPTDDAMTNVMSGLAGMKRLVQLLAAEGRLREIDNQPAEAARSYLDAIRFGNEISRGAIIHRLVGVACEAMGRSPLAKLAPRLKPEESRQVIADLEKIEKTRVTWDEVQRNESGFVRYHLRKNPHLLFVWAISWWQNRTALQRAQTKHNRIVAYERLLAAELSLRCCQSETAHPPARLAELVPNYLSHVPLDPFSGQPLIYRPHGTNWLLYSVGPDGVDNSGKRIASATATHGDLFFDSP